MADYVSGMGDIAAQIFFYTIIFVGVVLFLLLLWAIYYFMSYKHKSVVYDSERKDSAKLVRFKFNHSQGILKFFMKKPNRMIVPSADCFVPFKRSSSFLAVEQNGEFFMPLRLSPNPGFLLNAGDFKAVKLWHIQDVKKTQEDYSKKQSLFWQYAPIGLTFFVIVIHFVVILMLVKTGGFGGGDSVAGGVAGAGAQLIPGG